MGHPARPLLTPTKTRPKNSNSSSQPPKPTWTAEALLPCEARALRGLSLWRLFVGGGEGELKILVAAMNVKGMVINCKQRLSNSAHAKRRSHVHVERGGNLNGSLDDLAREDGLAGTSVRMEKLPRQEAPTCAASLPPLQSAPIFLVYLNCYHARNRVTVTIYQSTRAPRRGLLAR